MKKKLLILLVAVLGVMLLTGCQSNVNNSNEIKETKPEVILKTYVTEIDPLTKEIEEKSLGHNQLDLRFFIDGEEQYSEMQIEPESDEYEPGKLPVYRSSHEPGIFHFTVEPGKHEFRLVDENNILEQKEYTYEISIDKEDKIVTVDLGELTPKVADLGEIEILENL